MNHFLFAHKTMYKNEDTRVSKTDLKLKEKSATATID